MTARRGNRPEDIDLRALAQQGPVHFVGVSGAGVASLAELVLRSGGQVTGCDLNPGVVGERLTEMGARVVRGHDVAHIDDAVAVVTTAAVPQDHPELQAARRRGIPVLKRAAALGALVNQGQVVGIAGTHGKTTTTALTTAVLEAGGLEPTAFVGGTVPAWGSGLRPGGDRLFVVEADEYDRSFLTLRPDIAVVTTLEADHLDIFGSLEAVEEAFRRFLEPLPENGLLAACVDDAGAARLLETLPARLRMGYGLNRGAALRAVDVEARGRGIRCRVLLRNEELGELSLHVPGLHNLRNALAAVAVGLHLEVDFERISRGVGSFVGVARRFQELGEAGGVVVVDDYAHHPTEIEATVAAGRGAYPERRLVVAFQPHLYTRTRDFHERFGQALAQADQVWVTDVYPAREEPIEGVSGKLVADAARGAGADVVYHEDVATLPDALAGAVRSGDACLLLGAGNITDAARALFERLREKDA